jgi:hypothetical protein
VASARSAAGTCVIFPYTPAAQMTMTTATMTTPVWRKREGSSHLQPEGGELHAWCWSKLRDLAQFFDWESLHVSES